MVTIFINGKEVSVDKGSTILQACDVAGVVIPRFCYHERLSIAGNCRMCLVEVEKSPKPVASCAMPVMDGMKVFTNTPLVKKAREGVLEFLLVNHPLDCPICDQGGECDLQDQALIYGSDRGRFYEYKRGVEDKNCGVLIKTIMTRCIHCTRCIRFAGEIAGVEVLGTTGRGKDTEIGTYIEKTFDSELSGNVIDLCPVGALTSKPYAFTARSWELKSFDSIDVSDAVGSNIRIDTRGSEIMRILPRLNEDVNEEWISDKARFSYDGLKRQRLDNPMIRDPKTNKLTKTTWPKAFEFIKDRLNKTEGSKIKAIIGNLADAEGMLALKMLVNQWGSSNITCNINNAAYENTDIRSNYLFNNTLTDLENIDFCLLVGVNPRTEAPLVNTRLRKNYLYNDFYIANIGNPLNLTYPVKHLGGTTKTLIQVLEGKHPVCKKLISAKNPSIIVGNSFLQREDSKVLFRALQNLSKKLGFKLNILHTAASRVAGLDLNLLPGHNFKKDKFRKKIESNFYYLYGIDSLNDLKDISENAFIVYQGHHGNEVAQKADVILPGGTYTEKNATYANLEGRVQRAKYAFLPPGNAREDWKIIRALAEVTANVGSSSNLLKIENIHNLRKLFDINAPFLNKVSHEVSSFDLKKQNTSNDKHIVYKTPFTPLISNFYMTDIISKSSKIMAKCAAKVSQTNYIEKNV